MSSFAGARPLATVVINNYEYERFLAAAVDSALSQSYSGTEVVVVDDGSTDGSRAIVEEYGELVVGIFKENGGQTSALNAGFEACSGEVVVFLDADDTLVPTAVERAMERFASQRASKVQWPLWEVDSDGRRTGELRPRHALDDGDVRSRLLAGGPDAYGYSPTSGNAWPRWVLERIMPMPEAERDLGIGSASADASLSVVAALMGSVAAIHEPLGEYRVHGKNDYATLSSEAKLRRDVMMYEYRCRVLAEWCDRLGLEATPERWIEHSWFHRVSRSLDDIASVVGADGGFILVDEDEWGLNGTAGGRRRLPFPEREGIYGGRPPDGEAAVRELDRLRRAGATHIVFAWPALWWLDHYDALRDRLRLSARCVVDNDRLVIFDLR